MSHPNAFALAGILGWPVAQSRSPVIQNFWLQQHGIAGRYVMLPVRAAQLERALRGFAGKPPLDLSLARLPGQTIVADLIYTPPETPFLAAARERGNLTVNGLGLLLNQVRLAFEAWFGVRPDITPALPRAVAATF